MSKKRRERRNTIRHGEGSPLDYRKLWKDDEPAGDASDDPECTGSREPREGEAPGGAA